MHDEPSPDRFAGSCPDIDTLLEFAEHRLSEPTRSWLRGHIERCPHCMDEVAAVLIQEHVGSDTTVTIDTAAEHDRDVLRAPQIGRFQILGRIGAGGMGDVYAAYDPSLNRRVAIKVLKPSGATVDEARFAREAKALARISHPNVVQIHEAGIHGDDFFIAMEFVEGTTLKGWAHLPGARELTRRLDMLIQAGEGLAAAHAQGLVHRDFKPSNVLVGDDGRVRVADFGVARTQGHRTSPTTLDLSIEGPSSDDTLTQTGYAVGTPAYMAPEQLLGDVTAASDQFSFCVVAWELLFGVRPFRGSTTQALRTSIQMQDVVRPPSVKLASDLEMALRRGLCEDPTARFPSMTALLSELRRAQHPRSRRWWMLGASVAALAVVGTLAGTLVLAFHQPPPPCSDAALELRGRWDPSLRSRVENGLRLAVTAPDDDSVARVVNGLELYARTWTESHREACEATRVRHELPLDVMERRMTCLSTRRDGLTSLVETLVDATFEQAAEAESMLEELAPIESCQDLEYIRLDAAIQPEVDKARRLLSNANALRDKGYLEASREIATMALRKASVYDVPCLETEIHLTRAKASLILDGYEPALASARAAHGLFERCQRSRDLTSNVAQQNAVQSASVVREPHQGTPSQGPAARIAPPNSMPHGRSFSSWQSMWSTWVMETPTRRFLYSGPTENACAINQSGPVRFLVGTLNVDGTRTSVHRRCVVPEGTSIFFPAINEFHGAFDPHETEDKLRASLECARTVAGVLEINGHTVEDFSAYYSTSDVFSVQLPRDNAFGVDETTVPGLRLPTSISAGHYFFLEPLPVGTHHIRVTAVNACANLQRIEHTVVVESPHP